MDLRSFGRTDLRVSTLGLGCARIGGVFQNDASGFVDLLHRALDLGINFFDTADMYSQGESESLLGRAFRGKRDLVILATKAGYKLPAQRRLAGRLKPLLRPVIRAIGLRRDQLPSSVRGQPSQDFSPAYLRRALEGSLRRLGTDRVDLFQLHSPPADVVERGECIGALEQLHREGKVRWYGVSCDTAEAAHAALRHRGVCSLQLPISLLHRGMVQVLGPARQAGVAVIARECLANGLLAKDPGGIDLHASGVSAEEIEARTSRLAGWREVAAKSGCTLPQLALQFVTALEGVAVSLVGARTTAQLTGLVGQLGASAVPPEALRAVLAG